METVMEFLTDGFQKLLDVSLTATIVILCVIPARILLKKAPKIFSYALWGIVLLRLLVPVSIESPVGLIPVQTDRSVATQITQVLPEIELEPPANHTDDQRAPENTSSGEPLPQTSDTADPKTWLSLVWLLGVGVMVAYSAVSYAKLRRRIKVAVSVQKGVYLADEIATPFVMGIFRPKIYLPGNLDGTERNYIIAHERHHIRRGDHIFKALGFLALTVHWFNPLVWVAFALAGRDMEMSCDEAVIRKLGVHIRADYSASLLNLATGHRLFSITPLTFGEGNPTGRVRNLSKWKKPALWASILCALLCCVLAVCLLTDREAPEREETIETVPTAPTEAAVSQTETAPALTVSYGEDQSRIARVGALDGNFLREDGTEGKLRSDGVHPLEEKSASPSVELDPYSMLAFELCLQWDMKPDSVMVRYWDETCWDQLDSEPSGWELLQEAEGAYYFVPQEANCIYEVAATWDSDHNYSVTARYNFHAVITDRIPTVQELYDQYLSTCGKGSHQYIDLDEDGTQELFFQRSGGCEIVTVSDNKVVSVMAANHLFLCDGGIIGRYGEGGGGCTVFYYKMKDQKAVTVDVITMTFNDDAWYRCTDPAVENVTPQTATRITKEEALEVCAQYRILGESTPWYLDLFYPQ